MIFRVKNQYICDSYEYSTKNSNWLINGHYQWVSSKYSLVYAIPHIKKTLLKKLSFDFSKSFRIEHFLLLNPFPQLAAI
jgi:hypothetical protein